MTDSFAMETMARGYATARPPVHPLIVAEAYRSLGWSGRAARALDVGCGAGVSTKALADIAKERFGIEPAAAMLRWGREVAPGAQFAVGAAEALPVRDRSIDLMTAAGSLNYVDLSLFFPEARRVLRPRGALLVYDFSPGKSLRHTSELDEWFASFEQRYPPPRNEAKLLNPEILAQFASGFEMRTSRSFEIGLPLSPDFYLDYVLTETNVAAAVHVGTPLEKIRSWCADTLAPIWRGQEHEVLFHGYFACLI